MAANQTPGAAGDAVFRKIADFAPVVTIVIDETGVVTLVAGKVEAISGYRPDELVGTNMLDHLDVEWNPVAIESVADAMTGHGLRRPMLFRIRCKDGSLLVVEAIANAQMDDPDIKGLIAYLRPWDERSLLDQVLEAIAGSAPLAETFELLVRVMGAETLEADGAVLYDIVQGEARHRIASASLGEAQVGVGVVADSPWSVALQTGESCRRPVSELPDELRAEAEARGHTWCWAYPVPTLDGLSACLVLWRRLDEDVDHTCSLALERLVRLTGLVIDRDRSAADLAYAAHHDALTGLPNRAKFFNGLQDTLDDPVAGPLVGVLYLDLDGFKPVNDKYGHGVGDEVLREVARRLQRVVRASDVVSRLGGDEFTILCPAVSDPDVLASMAERVVAVVREPIVIGDVTIGIGASVGIAVAPPESCSIDVIIDAADAALYQAKAADKGTWRMAPRSLG